MTHSSPSYGQPSEIGDLNRLRQTLKTGDLPVELSADETSYSRDQDLVTATGNVSVHHGAWSLQAERVLFYRGEGRITAVGPLTVQQGDDTLRADSLDLDLITRSGVLTHGQVFFAQDHYYLTGERIERLADASYEFENATITACEETGGRLPWRIRARKLRVEPEQYLTARGVVFSVLDVPVAYLPYLIWPVKTERQSGLLPPQLGYSTADGLKVRQPVFVTLGPSHDVTVTVDERTKRGIGGAVEYRYKLSQRSEGIANVEVFRDRIEDGVRRRMSTTQVIAFHERLELWLSGEYVSDDAVLSDLDARLSERTRQFVESNAFLTYRDQFQIVTALARHTRDLSSTASNETHLGPQVTYRLPGLSVGGSPLAVWGQASYTRFLEPAGVTAQRTDVFPMLTWSQSGPVGFVVTPRVGVRETFYRRNGSAGTNGRRELGIAGVGVTTTWGREFGSGSPNRVRHLVESGLDYGYIGRPGHSLSEADQQGVQFDEIDTMSEANAVTAVVTNRVTATGKPADDARSWDPLWIRLTQTYRITHRPSSGEAWSPLRGEAVIRTPQAVQVSVDTFYDHASGSVASFDVDMRALVVAYGELEFGRRSTRPEGPLSGPGDLIDPLALGPVIIGSGDDIDFYTGAVRVNLGAGLTLANKTYYNREAGAFTEIDYGLLYRAQCWSVSVTYQDQPDRNEFGVLFTLVGGSTPDSSDVPDLFGNNLR